MATRTRRQSNSPYARPAATITPAAATPSTSGGAGKGKGRGKKSTQPPGASPDSALLQQLLMQQQEMQQQQLQLQKQLENITNATNKEDQPTKPNSDNQMERDPVLEQNQQGHEGQLPTPFISVTHDLDAHVPASIKVKITKSEYINLAFLLEGSLDVNREQTFDIRVAGLNGLGGNDTGNIVLRGPGPKRKIDSIETWTDAFIVFIHIFSKAHPTHQSELLAYLRCIGRAAKYGGIGYKFYDEKFRLAQADNPGRSVVSAGQ